MENADAREILISILSERLLDEDKLKPSIVQQINQHFDRVMSIPAARQQLQNLIQPEQLPQQKAQFIQFCETLAKQKPVLPLSNNNALNKSNSH
jgi:hypothetical protein